MGAWSTSITGNDTASDLRMEYAAAFYKYDVEEALQKIDSYVRSEMFDESDPEEWCDYFYSLAHFMWKKGILTDAVRDKAVEMIDSDFGLELWAESGEKTLNSRKKKLEDKIKDRKIEIIQDHTMINKDPNNYTCFHSTWKEELEKDQKILKDLEEEKEKIKNYLNKNWEKLESMEIK